MLALHLGCDEGPTNPTDPRIPPATGQPTSLTFLPCDYQATSTSCPVEARWGDGLYFSTREVTSVATWTSRSPSILRVVRPGVLMAVGEGAAQVDVTYEGTTTTGHFRVFNGEPPWWYCPQCEFHVQVRDQSGERLGGVLVEVVGGHELGRSAVSTSAGSAVFVPSLIQGPITVRGSKAGYRDWIGSAFLGGRGGNGAPGSETVGPVTMIPLS